MHYLIIYTHYKLDYTKCRTKTTNNYQEVLKTTNNYQKHPLTKLPTHTTNYSLLSAQPTANCK